MDEDAFWLKMAARWDQGKVVESYEMKMEVE